MKSIKNLRKNGIIKTGSKVKSNDILIGRTKKSVQNTNISKLLNSLFKKEVIKNISIKTNKESQGTITKVLIKKKKTIYCIIIYICEKRKIKIGDKIAGRHGNKGIISKVLLNEDMPYTQDGTPLDIILNPLGIPSRMNVGQIYECILGLAANNLKENYKITPFDETKNQGEASKVITYHKLNEAKKKSKKNWLFNANYPGKSKLIDGRNGNVFQQPILIGYSYILKLIHMVDDKINARLTGPYTLIMNQPVRGKSRNGGQRLGEMEVWAIEGYGAAYTLQEMLTLKADDIKNRSKVLYNLIKNKTLPEPNITESFKTLLLEIQSLCMDINIISESKHYFK